jgi:SNF2 family DNA or RNA helicase
MFAEPGCGKTTMALGAFKVLQRRKLATKMLVIAPLKPCYLVWGPEARKWTDFQHFRVEILHGPKKDEALARDADIYVINPEGLSWLMDAQSVASGTTGKQHVTVDIKRFKALGFDTLVIDELSKFKSTSSVRFKTLRAVLGTFSRRWGLTGSPASNGLLDLFGQCYVLDEGRSLGRYITHYRQQYFVPGHDGFSWVLKRDGAERIYERIKPLVLRLAASDYVDMPELVEVTRGFDLSPRARATYDELEDELLTVIGDRKFVAANSGVASMKCRQVVNGAIYLDREVVGPEDAGLPRRRAAKREWALVHDDKLDLLSDLVDELQGSPLLVSYDFNHDLERLRRRFGEGTPYIGAGVDMRRAQAVERAWNAGEVPLMFGHPASMGHGCNLQQAGSHVAFFGLTYDYELYDQFIRRVWRQGNAGRRVFVHHLVANDTVDVAQMWALRRKERGQNALFEALRDLRARRRQ